MRLQDTEKVSQLQVARLLGVAPRTLRTWSNEHGCPRRDDGDYDLAQVFAWRLEREAEQAEAMLGSVAASSDAIERWRLARAELAELELSTKRSEMIPAAAVKRDVGTIVEHFKAKLLGLPNKCAAALASFDKPEDCFDELTREMYELLDDLRTGFLKLIADGDLGGPVERDDDADS